MEFMVVGSVNVDIEVSVDRLPVEGETLLGDREATGIGGKGANQAVGLSRLHDSVQMICRTGNDDWADLALDQLRREGVNVLQTPRAPKPTGLAVVLRGALGQSTIVVAPGANMSLDAVDVLTHQDAVQAAQAVLVQAEVGDAPLLAAAELARGRLIVNPAPARLLPPALFERADLLIPNRLEFLQLHTHLTGQVHDPSQNWTPDQLRKLATEFPRGLAIVITLGANGCLVVDGEAVEVVPGVPVQAVDTTGAGDSFCAAISHAWLGGMTLVEAADFANTAAAASVMGIGAMRALPRGMDLPGGVIVSPQPAEGGLT
jgi:ribokinase